MAAVLIVGAGPVGLTLAAELARYGVPLRIIDRSPQPSRTSKALVIWSRTLELMDRMGCTGAFLASGLEARHATVREGTKVLGVTSFDHVASPHPFPLMIPQSETERLLAEHLSSFGVSIERQVELIGFEEHASGITARLRRADGREEAMETSWLLGCDGAHSAVRHGLGLEFRGKPQGDDWMLADIRIDGPGAPPSGEIAPFMHRDGPFVIFPIPGGRARVIASLGPTDPAHPRPDPTMAEVQTIIDSRTGGGFRASDPVWLSNFRINERKVADYRKGRAFLAGDAAHVHSPAGGQGMNTGMQDAVDLAWRLALVIREEAAETVLDSYSAERSAVGDMVLHNAGRMTEIATLSNPAAQAARNLAIHLLLGIGAVRDGMATTLSEIGIAYPDSPLSEGRGSGTRLAPENYDGPPPGTGREPRMVLYAGEAEQAAMLVDRFPTLLQQRVRRPANDGDMMIVRPDGYIGFKAQAAGAWDRAKGYLQRLAPASAA